MSIYILEDQLSQLNILHDIIRQLLEKFDRTSENIFAFQDVTNLLLEIKKDDSVSIYFLDIQIGQDDLAGFEAASVIRKLDRDGIIVYVTSHPDRALESYQYEVAALGFISKKNNKRIYVDQIQKYLSKYFSITKVYKWKSGLTLLPTNKARDFWVEFDDILYFFTNGDHSVVLKMKNGLQRIHTTLKELEEAEPRLWRVQRSYLINRRYVKKHRHTPPLLEMSDGEFIAVSRKEYKNFREWFS